MISNGITDIRYLEHESSNAYRNYPFSETASMSDSNGAAFATDILVDASLYPVVPSMSDVVLSRIDFSIGLVSARCGMVNMSGSEDGGVVELFDESGRHAGTLVCGPGWRREAAAGRLREFEGMEFSSFVSCPVVHNGIFSVTDEGRTIATTRRNLVFEGDGCVNPVVREDKVGYWIRFDVQFDDPDVLFDRVVRQVVFAAVGKTPFSLVRQSDNTVFAATPSIDRDDVCWEAHKDDVVVVSDTCKEGPETCYTLPVPYKSDEIEVCASDTGSVNIVSDDTVDYRNALLVETVEGEMRPVTPKFDSSMSYSDIIESGGRMLERPVQSGNGIRISMAGLHNGR